MEAFTHAQTCHVGRFVARELFTVTHEVGLPLRLVLISGFNGGSYTNFFN